MMLAEEAQAEGRSYGMILSEEVSTHDFEGYFVRLSMRLLKDDLYSQDAWLFECFTDSQRRLLKYILSRLTRESDRRHSSKISRLNVQRLEEVMKQRRRDSYRVEHDIERPRGTQVRDGKEPAGLTRGMLSQFSSIGIQTVAVKPFEPDAQRESVQPGSDIMTTRSKCKTQPISEP
jgi:hypothetical protein